MSRGRGSAKRCDATTSTKRRGRGWMRAAAARRKVMQGRGTQTSQQTRGKREERRQQTRGNGALIGRGCAFRGGGRVKRIRGRGINTTTSYPTRDYHGGSKSDGDGNGDGECRDGIWRRPPWSSWLRLRLRSLRTMPMAATAVSPLSAARLSRRGWGN